MRLSTFTLWLVRIAYAALLVYEFYSNWGTNAIAGWFAAAVWYGLYILVDETNTGLRKTIRKNSAREITDYIKFGAEMLEATLEHCKKHHKREAELEAQVAQRDDLIRKYDRFQKTPSKKASAKKGTSKKAAGPAKRKR